MRHESLSHRRREPLLLHAWHCRDYRGQSSGASGPSLWVAPGDFELPAGEPRQWTIHGEAGAAKICAFWPTCGSRLCHAGGDEGDPLSVEAALLDGVSRLRACLGGG